MKHEKANTRNKLHESQCVLINIGKIIYTVNITVPKRSINIRLDYKVAVECIRQIKSIILKGRNFIGNNDSSVN